MDKHYKVCVYEMLKHSDDNCICGDIDMTLDAYKTSMDFTRGTYE